MKTIKYQNGTVGTITYKKTEKGILKNIFSLKYEEIS